ncbi:hypothetical protein KBB27_00125 [Patescibacteria group bacterium]|nr:hypothetical protein [Patescibacteria group bacterium]
MKVFFVVLSLLPVLGSGCVRDSLRSNVLSAIASSTQTTSTEGSDFPPYRTLFQREAKPEWKKVRFDGFSLSVPYSSQWKVSAVGMSVYDPDHLHENVSSLRFGRPSDAGTFFAREYIIYRELRDGKFEDNSLERLKIDLASACVDGYGAKLLKIGNIEGIAHHSGGAMGCSMGFAFNRGRYTYYLYKSSDIKGNPPEIDDEMRRVVESIQE